MKKEALAKCIEAKIANLEAKSVSIYNRHQFEASARIEIAISNLYQTLANLYV